MAIHAPTPASSSRGAAVEESPQRAAKRLNLVLSDAAYEEMMALRNEQQRTFSELVRLALGLLRVAVREARNGHRLVVTDENGNALKEIVLPR